jgi:hypothetical protein
MISPLTPKSSSTPSSMRAFCSSASLEILPADFFGSARTASGGIVHSPRGEKANLSCASETARAPGFNGPVGVATRGPGGSGVAGARGAATPLGRGAYAAGLVSPPSSAWRPTQAGRTSAAEGAVAGERPAPRALIGRRRRRFSAAFAVRSAWIAAPIDTIPSPGSSSPSSSSERCAARPPLLAFFGASSACGR